MVCGAIGKSTIHTPIVNPVAISATVTQCSAIAVRVYAKSVGIIGRTSAMRASGPLDSPLLPSRIRGELCRAGKQSALQANNGRSTRIPQLVAIVHRWVAALAICAGTALALTVPAYAQEPQGAAASTPGTAPPVAQRRPKIGVVLSGGG